MIVIYTQKFEYNLTIDLNKPLPLLTIKCIFNRISTNLIQVIDYQKDIYNNNNNNNNNDTLSMINLYKLKRILVSIIIKTDIFFLRKEDFTEFNKNHGFYFDKDRIQLLLLYTTNNEREEKSNNIGTSTTTTTTTTINTDTDITEIKFTDTTKDTVISTTTTNNNNIHKIINRESINNDLSISLDNQMDINKIKKLLLDYKDINIMIHSILCKGNLRFIVRFIVDEKN